MASQGYLLAIVDTLNGTPWQGIVDLEMTIKDFYERLSNEGALTTADSVLRLKYSKFIRRNATVLDNVEHRAEVEEGQTLLDLFENWKQLKQEVQSKIALVAELEINQLYFKLKVEKKRSMKIKDIASKNGGQTIHFEIKRDGSFDIADEIAMDIKVDTSGGCCNCGNPDCGMIDAFEFSGFGSQVRINVLIPTQEGSNALYREHCDFTDPEIKAAHASQFLINKIKMQLLENQNRNQNLGQSVASILNQRLNPSQNVATSLSDLIRSQNIGSDREQRMKQTKFGQYVDTFLKCGTQNMVTDEEVHALMKRNARDRQIVNKSDMLGAGGHQGNYMMNHNPMYDSGSDSDNMSVNLGTLLQGMQAAHNMRGGQSGGSGRTVYVVRNQGGGSHLAGMPPF